MLVKDLFRRLSYGELSNLSVGGEGAGGIPDKYQPKIISYANEGLVRLHSRFLLRENVLLLEVFENLTYYYMLDRFARSKVTDPPCPQIPYSYILDSETEPFQNDVLKILAVTGIDGLDFPLNDTEDAASLFTPQPNLLQIPRPLPDTVLTVQYQARHPMLTDLDEHQEIDLPFALEGALAAFIAGKVFDHMNGQDNQAKALSHYGVFDSICEEVKESDLVNQSTSNTNTKFELRGFK